MQRSRDESVKEILHKKLKDFEAEVPEGSSELIFSELRKPSRAIPKLATGLLLLVTVLSYVSDDPLANDSASSQLTGEVVVEHHASTSVDASTSRHERTGLASKSYSKPNSNSSKAVPTVVDRIIVKRDMEAPSAIGKSNLLNEPISFRLPDVTGEKLAEYIDPITADNILRPVGVFSPHDNEQPRSIRFVFSAMPFFSYNHIVPTTTDAVHLSNFQTPSSFSSDRIGFNVSTALEYPLSTRNSLMGGLSYFHYNTMFEYGADEVLQRVGKTNTVNESTQGISFCLGASHALSNELNRYFVQGGTDLQFLINSNASAPSGLSVMIYAGLGRQWMLRENSAIRLQPTIHYSLTRFSYGGLRSQPFWIGVEMGYVIGK